MKKRTIFALITIILIFMAEPVWGNLQKALDNPQTINQAIDEAITAHEADSDAHTGAGESLETHKSQEIIDHPAGSFLGDKISITESTYITNFESWETWVKVGEVNSDGWPGLYLYVEDGINDETRLSSTYLKQDGLIDYSKNWMLQLQGWIDQSPDVTVRFQLGNAPGANAGIGFGFEIVDGTPKGFWKDNDGINYTADLGIDPEIQHIYRAFYDKTDKEVRFYVDGELLATIEDITPVGYPSAQVHLQLLRGTATDDSVQIREVITILDLT